jgi:hypothetical protein
MGKWYTILREEKAIGRKIAEILVSEKEGRWTWGDTTLIRCRSIAGPERLSEREYEGLFSGKSCIK